jgi:hypothetical protein
MHLRTSSSRGTSVHVVKRYFCCSYLLVVFLFVASTSRTRLSFAQAPAPLAVKTTIPDEAYAISDNGILMGRAVAVVNGQSIQFRGPFGNGSGTGPVSANTRGQILVLQISNGPHYFVYDLARKDLTPVSQDGRVAEGGAVLNVRLAYLTRLDDDGRVYGVYGTPHGPCAVVGTPAMGNPGEKDPPPNAPGDFTLIGCPGGADLHIRAINAKGQITGGVKQQGFIWSKGQLTTFRFPGARTTEGLAINDAGLVAGILWAGNRTNCDGDVSNHFTPGMGQGQMGFTYDGQQFRLVCFPDRTAVFLNGINNRGQVVGFHVDNDKHYGFVYENDKLPIVHMLPTPAELTQSAAANLPANTAYSGGDGIDLAFKILVEGGLPAGALSLRAYQALRAEEPTPDEINLPMEKGREHPETFNGITYHEFQYCNLDGLTVGTRGTVMEVFLEELASAQTTPKGAELVVQAIHAIAGATGVADLNAAGELTTLTRAEPRDPSEVRARQAARGRLKQDIDAAVVASLVAHPLKIPPANMERWQPTQGSPAQREALAKKLREIQDGIDSNAAKMYLAFELIVIEPRLFDVGFKVNGRARVVYDGLLFESRYLTGLRVMSELVRLKSHVSADAAEKTLRTFAGATPTGNSPGLHSLQMSGSYLDKKLNTYYQWQDREALANTLGGVAEHQMDAFLVHAASGASLP